MPSFQKRGKKPGWCWRCCWCQPGCCGTQHSDAAEPTWGTRTRQGRGQHSKGSANPSQSLFGDQDRAFHALLLPLRTAAGSGAALQEDGTSLQPSSPHCSQKTVFLSPKHQGEQPQVTVPHVEPGQGWHRRSKATLSLQTFTSSAPTCFTARSQAPAYYRQKGEASPDPTLRLFVGPPGRYN